LIPYGRQSITKDDVSAVVEALESDWLTQGPAVPRFEEALKGCTGADHAVAVNSATSALHLACVALGLVEGDALWTVPITFVASANCARYCGASVDFVDIDSRTWNMSVDALARKLEQAEIVGRLPKIVVPVAFAGQSCDMQGIRALADRYGFSILEDASHAIGGRHLESAVGCGDFADISVFSFHPVKIVTTAEGGAAMTNRPELAERMALLRTHGITRDPSRFSSTSPGAWYYEQQELGWNYRMTDLQAALGASQVRRLGGLVDARNALARRYDKRLQGLPLTRPYVSSDNYSAFHLYVVLLPPGVSRARVFDRLRAAGIGVNVHYIPVHLQPYYRAMGFGFGDFPVAEDYYTRCISLPLFPDLTGPQQDYVCDVLEHALLEVSA